MNMTPSARNPDVDRSVDEIVGRAGDCTVAVAEGLATGPLGHAIHTVARDVVQAIRVDVMHGAANPLERRVSFLIRRLLREANTNLERLLGGIRDGAADAAKEILDASDPAHSIFDPIASRVYERVLNADTVRTTAANELVGLEDPASRVRELRRLERSNRRWVGPVQTVSRGIGHLWFVYVGILPLAPIAAGVLLAWTILTSADQLDTPGYPDLWKGVIRRAAGE